MPLVVTIVGFDEVVSRYVVVSVVAIAIDFAALTLVVVVVSGSVIGSDCVKLPPSALFIYGVIVGIVEVVNTPIKKNSFFECCVFPFQVHTGDPGNNP